MPVIFHIGYPKTATTWFQENFFPRIKNHHFIHRDITNKHFFFSDSFLFNPEVVKKSIGFSEDEKILLSSELMVTAINHGWHYGNYARTCAQKIKQVFPDAQIIVFIRNQQSLAASAYQQYVKNGGTFSMKRYLYSGRGFSFEHLLFDKLVEYYDSLFGQENVHVFVYEEMRKDPAQFLNEFCKKFDFEVDLDKLSLAWVNRGLRKGFVPLIKFFNLFHFKPVGRKNYICHLPGVIRFIQGFLLKLNRYHIFGRYLKVDDLLSPKDLEICKNFYLESNRKLGERIGAEILASNGYYL